MKKKKPQIRFNGFTEDWEKKKLGELGKWYKGQPLSKSDIRECGTFPCIHYGELFSYTEIIREVTSRTNVKPSILSSGNDLLFPDSDVTPDGLGRCSSLTDKGILLGAGINILQLESCVRAPFCSLCTNVHKEQIIERVTGTTVRHTKPSSLSEVVISISPSIPEQEKIGVFLTTLDKLIAKLEAKLDKLRKLKQALLEKMFVNVNGGGYETPEIRFKGYTDKWQVKELREVFEMPTNRISGSELQADRYISTEHILQNFEGVEPTTSMPANLSAIRFFQSDILMANIRPYLKKIWLSDRNGGASSDVIVFHITTKSDPAFLYYELTNGQFIEYVMESIQGSKMPRGNKQAMQAFKMSIAPLSEQEQIGKCFTQIDSHFSKTSTKLTKLRNIKQSLLQKMFA